MKRVTWIGGNQGKKIKLKKDIKLNGRLSLIYNAWSSVFEQKMHFAFAPGLFKPCTLPFGLVTIANTHAYKSPSHILSTTTYCNSLRSIYFSLLYSYYSTNKLGFFFRIQDFFILRIEYNTVQAHTCTSFLHVRDNILFAQSLAQTILCVTREADFLTAPISVSSRGRRLL